MTLMSNLKFYFRQNIRSFGMSISPCVDIDENDYKDLLVGAPQSATAVLLRFPFLKIGLFLSFLK